MRVHRIFVGILLGFLSIECAAFSKVVKFGPDRDSIVLDDPKDEDIPCYSRLRVFRKSKVVLLEHMLLPACVEDKKVLNVFRSSSFAEIIIEADDRPLVSRWLVIRRSNSGDYHVLGLSPSSTGEILGDIDGDGIVEIGGYSYENVRSCEDKVLVFKAVLGFPVACLPRLSFSARKEAPLVSDSAKHP